MLIMLTTLLLIGTAAVVAALQILRPRFRFGWMLAAGGAGVAILSVFLWLPQLPISVEIPLWQSSTSTSSFATFAASSSSWPFALGLSSLALVLILTAPTRGGFPNPSTWAVGLGVSALGILATTAEGPLTLVLFWAALDLAEAGVALARRDGRSAGAKLPASFSLRLAGMGLALLGLVLGETGASNARFAEIQGSGSWLLPLAALLRIVALAPPGAQEEPSASHDEIAITLQLVASAASVAFLSQLNPTSQSTAILLQAACAATSIYAAWMWFRAPDDTSGRPYWLMAAGSFAVGSALRGIPLGTSAWGTFILLTGSALFFRGKSERFHSRVLLTVMWIGSSLPMSLTATSWMGGGGLQDLLLPIYLVAQAMLVAGCVHSALSSGVGSAILPTTRWLQWIHRTGIGLPLMFGVALGLWGWPGALQIGAPLAAITIVLGSIVLVWAKRRFAFLSPVPGRWIPAGPRRVSLMLQHGLARLADMLRRWAHSITRTMEGEAGILWSLVLLLLFVALIVDRGG